MGILLLGASGAGVSKRSVRNADGGDAYNYMYIDHFKLQDAWGPVSLSWLNSAPNWNSAILDANGYPNISTTRAFGGGIRIRSSANYSGNYIFDGLGTGQISFPSANATYTVNVGLSSNVTVNSNGNWTLTGSPFRVVFTYSGPRQLLSYSIGSTDPGATGAYMRTLRFYRSVDEADLIAGKIFCSDYKSVIVAEDPSAFRSLDMNAVNGTYYCRFPQRTPLGYATYRGDNWNASPPYGDTGITGVNSMTLAAATGTPASMQHGELVMCRVGTALARCAAGQIAIQAITNANPGKITANGHGFNTGDRVIIPEREAMTQLYMVPLTITVVDVNNFTIGIDTTSFSVFGGAGSHVAAYIDLQVGSGNDRTPYPIQWVSGSQPAGIFGGNYFTQGSYIALVFDKTISGKANTSGVFTMGAWITRTSFGASSTPILFGAPPEVVGILINELNSMSPAKPIDLWYPMPSNGLLSMDPDYVSGDNYHVGVINLLLNGNGGSFGGITGNRKIFIENSNETWNNFSQGTFYAWKAVMRWGYGIGGALDYRTDYTDMGVVRSQVMTRDIKASFPGNARLKFVMSGQGTYGYAGTNAIRIDGSSTTLNDATNPSHLAPMVEHDLFSFAGYFSAPDESTLAALAAAWAGNVSNPTAQEANCQTWVNLIIGTAGMNQETIAHYTSDLVPGYITGVYTGYGKQIVNYEGGWNRVIIGFPNSSGVLLGNFTSGSASVTGVQNNSTVPNGSYIVGNGISDGLTTLVTAGSSGAGTFTLSANATYSGAVAFAYYDVSSLFLRACKRSQAWANAHIAWFNQTNNNPALGMFADFNLTDSEWGHFSEDAYDTQFTSSTAYANPDLAWTALKNRNASVN